MTPTQETADIRTICQLAGLCVDTIDGADGFYTVAIYPPSAEWRATRLTPLLLPDADWTVDAGRYDERYVLETLEFKRTIQGRNAR